MPALPAVLLLLALALLSEHAEASSCHAFTVADEISPFWCVPRCAGPQHWNAPE